MSDNNLPGEGTVDDAPTEASLISDIADLLDDDPPADPVKGDEDTAKAAPDDEGDEPDIDVTEDVEQDDAEDEDGSEEPEIKGGRFAPDTAKVTLDDGSVITVADLKRNNLFQRDYTKKTTELSERTKSVESKASEVDQHAQSLAQYSERLTEFAKAFLPQPPEPFTGTPQSDPIGYMEHMELTRKYNDAVMKFQAIDQERSTLTQKQQQELATKAEADFASEMQQLEQKDRFFADTAKAKAFLEEVVTKGSEWWGITREDIPTLRTAKQWLILRDALRYRKALAKAPEVTKQVQAKPAARPGKRADPRARVSAERNARSERLRRDGTFQAGVDSLMDLDL